MLQWLSYDKNGSLLVEGSETKDAMAVFGDADHIAHFNVHSRKQARSLISKWLKGNNHASYLYIGAHGDDYGIGSKHGKGLTWRGLHTLLRQAKTPIALWLGACSSQACAEAWSAIRPYREHIPVDYIIGVEESLEPRDLTAALIQLLENLSVNPVRWVDQELAQVRSAVESLYDDPYDAPLVHMYYLAFADRKKPMFKYSHTEDFIFRFGLSFRGYLEARQRKDGTINERD